MKNVNFVYGQTGSGKTRKIVMEVVDHLKSGLEGKIIICALHSINAVEALYSEVIDKMELDLDKKEVNVVKKRFLKYVSKDADSNFILLKYVSRKEKGEEYKPPLVICTTHEYLNTRGDSFVLYKFHVDLLWLCKLMKLQTIFFMDEAHLFHDTLVWSFKTWGLYRNEAGIGNIMHEKPINQVNVNFKDASVPDYTFYPQTTRHSYDICSKSRNPRVFWDRRVNTETFNFPEFEKDPDHPQSTHLGYTYKYFYNKSYSSSIFKDIPLTCLLGSIHPDSITKIKAILNEIGIQSISYRDIHYFETMNNYQKTAPYLVERVTDSESSHDRQPGQILVSGYHLFPLYLITEVFSEIYFYSASLDKHHYSMWGYLGIAPTRNELPVIGTQRSDFGAIFLNSKNATAKDLELVRSELGDIIHFSHNQEEQKQLSNKLSQDPEAKYNYVAIDRLYRKDIVRSKDPTTPITSSALSEVDSDKLYLSYWQSSLSTGTDLKTLNVCSVDLKLTIPFIFVPADESCNKSKINLSKFIFDFIIQRTKQMASRICRGAADHFKIIILNRFDVNSLSDIDKKPKSIAYEKLLKCMLGDNQFKEKFKNFKLYKLDGTTKTDLLYLKHLLGKKQTELFNFYLEKNPTNLEPDLLNWLRSSPKHLNMGEVIKNLPKKYNNLKSSLKENQVTNEYTLQGTLQDLNPLILNIYIKDEITIISFLNVKSGDSTAIDLTTKSGLSELTSFVETNLKPNTLLIEFSSNNSEIAILDYLIQLKEGITFNYIMNHCRILKTTNKAGHSYVKNKIFKHLNLKLMCSSKDKHSKLTLGQVALYFNYSHIPNELVDSPSEFVRHNNKIICILYNNHFSDLNIQMFDTYCSFLQTNYAYRPSSKRKLEVFCYYSVKKWSAFYLDMLNMVSPKRGVQKNIKKLLPIKLDTLLTFFNNIHWKNEDTRLKLQLYYQNDFYFSYSEKGKFRDKNNQPLSLDLVVNNLAFTVGSGGLVSKNAKNFINAHKPGTLFDIDIKSFYGSIVKEFELIQLKGLSEFFNFLMDERLNAQKDGNKALDLTLKLIINTITGNLGTPHSEAFNHQTRFDMISLSQLIIINFIDFMEHCGIMTWGLRTDGLIIKTKNVEQIKVLEEWASKFGLRLSISELTWVSVKANKIVRSLKNGDIVFDGIKSLSNFTSDIPLKRSNAQIYPYIIKNPKLPFVGNVLTEKDLDLFMYNVTYNSSAKHYIKDGDKIFLQSDEIRFLLGKNTPYALYKKTKNNETLVYDNIIPINTLKNVPKEDISLKDYHQDALKCLAIPDSHRSSAVGVLTAKKNNPVKISDRTVAAKIEKIHGELAKFYTSHGKDFKIVPKIYKNGNYGFNLLGNLSSNVIKTPLTKKDRYTALALLITQSMFVLDFDEPAEIPHEFKTWLKKNISNICLSYHSKEKMDLVDVIETKRFKLLFKCEQETISWLQSIKGPLKMLSVDVFYNKDGQSYSNSATVCGYHRIGDSIYHLAGGVNLGNLRTICKEICQFVNDMVLKAGKIPIVKGREEFRIYAVNPLKAKKLFKILVDKQGGYILPISDGFKYISPCPNKHLHTSPSAQSDFSIVYFNTYKLLIAKCWHHSCSEANYKWCKEFFKGKNLR